MTETTSTTKRIDLIAREYDHRTKCPMCGFRTTVRWNLGEDEREELAACGDCTTRHIAAQSEFTVRKNTSDNPTET